jgi:DNA-binding MarR family transcriptional regulator
VFFLKELPSRRMLEAYAARFPEMDVDTVEQALHLLRRASLLLREIERYFAAQGLSQTRFLILVVLDREPERDWLQAKEIAERLDVSRPTVTDTLKAMRREGWLAAGPDQPDARAKAFALTEAGRARLHALLPGYYRVIQDFMAAHDPQTAAEP